jgi:hypothetical protein
MIVLALFTGRRLCDASQRGLSAWPTAALALSRWQEGIPLPSVLTSLSIGQTKRLALTSISSKRLRRVISGLAGKMRGPERGHMNSWRMPGTVINLAL